MGFLNGIWQWIAVVLGYPMQWFYQFYVGLGFPLPYVFAMFTFAIFTTLLMFPLAVKQQKSSAKMAAMQTLLLEVRKTFAKDQKRQQLEQQKLQDELGISPFSGCLPLLIQFPLLLGLVEVIYAPLRFMLQIPADLLNQLKTIAATATGTETTNRLIENSVIELIKDPSKSGLFAELAANPAYQADLLRIENFDMSLGSINLWQRPVITEPSWLWLLPAFSIVTMVFSMLIANKMSGAAQAGTPGAGKATTLVMALVTGVFMFSYPAGTSLYWGLRNLVNIAQSAILRKVVNSEKIKQEVIELYNEKKQKSKSKNKKIVVVDEKTGQEIEKTVTASELAKLRLQRAREIDAERYDSEEEPALEKAAEYEGKKEESKAKKQKKETKTSSADTEEFDKIGAFKDKKNTKKK